MVARKLNPIYWPLVWCFKFSEDEDYVLWLLCLLQNGVHTQYSGNMFSTKTQDWTDPHRWMLYQLLSLRAFWKTPCVLLQIRRALILGIEKHIAKCRVCVWGGWVRQEEGRDPQSTFSTSRSFSRCFKWSRLIWGLEIKTKVEECWKQYYEPNADLPRRQWNIRNIFMFLALLQVINGMCPCLQHKGTLSTPLVPC